MADIDLGSLTHDTSFRAAWAGIEKEIGPVRGQWYTDNRGDRRRSGSRVQVDAHVQLRPDFQRFLRRMDRLPKQFQKVFRQRLRRVGQQTILPILRGEIPQSDKQKRHIRATAAVRRVTNTHLVFEVGTSRTFVYPKTGKTYGLWYAAIIHSELNPFFPKAFQRAWRPFNRRLIDELDELMAWWAGNRAYFI